MTAIAVERLIALNHERETQGDSRGGWCVHMYSQNLQKNHEYKIRALHHETMALKNQGSAVAKEMGRF